MANSKSLHRLAAALLVAPLLIGAAPAARLARAVETQLELVAGDPGNGGALNDLGNLLVESRRYDEAEEAYRRAMKVAPDRAEPPFNLALLLAADHPREARRLLKTMLKKHPDHAWGHYQLGTLYQANRKRGHALDSYRLAFRLDPSLSDPRINPHVIDNSLTTAAMLEAFSEIATTITGERIYDQPGRIKGLLLPPLIAGPEPMDDAEPMEEMEKTGEQDAAEEMIEEVVAGPGG